MNLELDLANYDKLFEVWRQKHPNGTFSQFSVQRMAAAIDKGRAHTTLGPNLNQGKTWWKDGEEAYKKILSRYRKSKQRRIAPRSLKFCDYGCGSLRVSAHLIKRQNPSCVVGLDVTEDFIHHGRTILGGLIEEKEVVTGTITDKIGSAIDLNVDVVFSSNVSSHVHPDETEIYYENLKKVAHKPGSLAMIHVLVSPKAVRFQRSGWGWPREFYIESMKPMKLIYETIEENVGVVEYRDSQTL